MLLPFVVDDEVCHVDGSGGQKSMTKPSVEPSLHLGSLAMTLRHSGQVLSRSNHSWIQVSQNICCKAEETSCSHIILRNSSIAVYIYVPWTINKRLIWPTTLIDHMIRHLTHHMISHMMGRDVGKNRDGMSSDTI